MIRSTLRQLRSRASRTAFTVAGIAIGVLALVVVGALAEQLGTIVARSTAVNNNSIFALAAGRTLYDPAAGKHIERDLAAIRGFAGVRDVVPEVVLPLSPGGAQSGRFGPPSFIFGMPQEARRYAGALSIARGRDIAPGETRLAIVGADFAASTGAGLGDVIALYGNSYTVTGILRKSFTIFDAAVIVPLEDARALIPQLAPPTLAHVPDIPASAAMAVLDPKANAGAIARRISLQTGFEARDPAESGASLAATVRVFDSIIFGAALVALLVSAFSIVNTMTIAVAERTREIGIRKAIGAGDGDILREFLLEAAVIGALGGAIGLATGTLLVTLLNLRNGAHGDLELFAVTPRLAAGAFVFAVVLSALAGLLPAIRAARLVPTEALRSLS